MSKKITIFDTTLRDGEQSPGFSMNTSEKIRVARQLDRLKVDIIEAGFPITSEDDFKAVSQVASIVESAGVCALARAVEKDITVAGKAVSKAKKPIIHTFVATSPVHMQYKLKKEPQEVIQMAVKAVKLALEFTDHVIFSPEDATRSQPEFLYQVLAEVIKAGAKTLNIPDTVGYSVPEEFGAFIKGILENVPGAKDVVISTHCQNDLGLATANSLSGVLNGAGEIQCTINGIGERAGNASLEEVVMALKTRADFYNCDTNIQTKELYNASKLITNITGVAVQPNKAIVGANAFAHESGIHQDGVLKHRETYEIMKPADIGLSQNRIVLGKHSGRHAIKSRLEALGYHTDEDQLKEFYTKFKTLADKKKEIFDADLQLLMLQSDADYSKLDIFSLNNLVTHSQLGGRPWAELELKLDKTLVKELDIEDFQDRLQDDLEIELTETDKFLLIKTKLSGDGQVDAAYGAINRIVNLPNKLLEYSVNAVTEGIDAQATVNVRIQHQDRMYSASSANTDIIVASIEAYLKSLNQILLQS